MRSQSELDADLLKAVKKGDETQVKILLNAKANIEAKGSIGNTPLNLAISCCKDKIAQMLIEAKANIESKFETGGSSLIFAIMKQREAIVRKLIEAKVNMEAKADSGYPPIAYSIVLKNESICKMLIDAKANIEVVIVNHCSGATFTPLSLAASQEDSDSIVKMLIDAKAKVFVKNENHHIPLELANSPAVKNLLETAMRRRIAAAFFAGLHHRSGKQSMLLSPLSRRSLFDQQVLGIPLALSGNGRPKKSSNNKKRERSRSPS